MRLETWEHIQMSDSLTPAVSFAHGVKIVTGIIYPDDMEKLKELVKFSKNEGDNYFCLVTPELMIDLIGQSEQLKKIKEGS